MPNYSLKIIIEGEDRASGAIKNVGSALGDIGKIAAGVGLGNLLSDGIKGFAGIAKGALDSYASYERLGQSINALTAKQALLAGQAGTMEQALAQTSGQSKELLGWIQKLAIESPFRQDDVAQAFRMSMALGFNTSEAQRLTQAMLNFATATGQGGDTIERISRALGQMRTKGKVSMEEINQLTEAGVDAMRILQQATGKSGEALSKDIQKGAVDANTAINAIITDTEKLYAGAGKAASTSFAGMLSSLDEARDIIGRTLFTGVFEQLSGPLSALTAIVTAPEFTAGLEKWSATLGSFTGDQLDRAAGAMERIDAAIAPLLNAGAPPWLAALQGIATAGGSDFKVTITPEVTSIKLPSAGLGIDVTATATKLDLGAGLPALAISANIKPEDQATITSVLDAAAKGGAKGFGYELGVQSRLALQQQAGTLSASFTAWAADYRTKLDASLSTWQPVIGAVGAWVGDTPAKLFAQAQTPFNEPIMVAGSWLAGALGSLWDSVQGWFSANPINLNVQTSYTGDTQPLGLPSGTTLPNDITPPMPSYSGDPRYAPVGGGWNGPKTSSTGGPAPVRHKATGDGFFYGGWTWVGEEGPELLKLPRGARILSNQDSQKMIGQNAGGTTKLPPGAGPLVSLLGSLGLWVPQKQPQMGPATKDQASAWKDFTTQGTQAMQTAADRTGAAFEDTAKKVNSTFESALQGVPGLFNTSQVTADDMRKSQLGLYQPKADEYLRQLSDEVLNGKDWGSNVDIKDAAKRAGIDPNLPNDIILELVKEAWNNSSLFAEGKNLDLINTDAVKAAIEQQQKELSGQASLKMLFGITDENLQAQSQALGQGLAAVFGGASETDAVKAAGATVLEGIGKGLTDTGGAAKNVAGMADAMKTAIGTPANQSALYDNGYAAYAPWAKGFAAAAAAAPITPPGGGTAPPGTTTPPGANALGTPAWRGGWTVAGEYGPELLNLPGGTSIYDAPTSQRMRRGGQPMIVNQTFVVNDRLMAEQAAQRAVQLIRKGGR